MKKATFIGCILAGWCFAGACSDADNTLAKYISDAVEITDVELLLPSSGKSVESTIITSDNPWSIEGESDWCSISPRNGGSGTTTVYFTLTPNNDYDDRSCIFTLHSTVGDIPLTVYQKKKDAIIFSKDRFDNIAMDGGEIKVALQSNVAYRVEIPAANNWIQHRVASRTRGLEAREETFLVASTADFNARSGIIVFINLENEKMRDTVTVYQVQRDQIILGAASIRIPLEGETVRIPVRSNIVYEVNIPEAITWVHAEQSNRADEIVLRIDESTVDRSAVIAIRDKNNHALYSPFAIEQQEKETLKFQTEEADVPREGGKIKLTVLENLGGKYRLIIPEYAPWIKLSTAPVGSRALTSGDVWLEVVENSIDDVAREGRVFVRGTENTDLLATFVIRQAGGREPESDERITLLKIAEALGGLGSWQNNWQETWQITKPLKSWTGVVTDPTGAHVVTLGMSTQARGQLPKEIGDLPYLENLRLEVSPNITGAFPPQIANLKKLRRLSLSARETFEGIIPEFGALTSLKYLHIWGGFSGTPGAHMDAIGWLENLDTLELLSGNYGTVMPETWGNLKNLKILKLDNIPYTNIDPVGGMTALRNLSLANMQGITTLPESIGNLRELTSLTINHTGLTELPHSVGNLAKLDYLYIVDTKIASLPSTVENLKALTSLTLSRNALTALPEALSGMTNLTTLQVEANPQLAGQLPANIGNLDKLTRLLISDNPLLGGPIPESISRMQRLTTLNLQGNALTALPESIGEMVNLTTIFLQGNDFQGSIPESIGNLKKLDALYINRPEKTPYKGLVGTIPESLGSIETLRYIRLENNQLSGSIPASFSGLKALHTMWLSNNELTGNLPGFFATFPNLTVLLLENNGLSGSLPVDFRDVSGLQQLNLYNNNLEGAIPEGFHGKGTSYSTSNAILDLRMNKLRGVIPEGFLIRTSEDTVHFKYREQKPGFGFDN